MTFAKSQLFYLSLLSFIIGIAWCSYFLDFVFLSSLWFYTFCLIILIGLVFFWSRPLARASGLILLFFILGVWRYQAGLPAYPSANKIWFYNDKDKVEFVGIVSSEPDRRISQSKLTVKASRLKKGDQDEKREVSGRVLINTRLYPQYEYGDKLLVSCQLKSPKPIDNFAYDKYLAKDEIYSYCHYPSIKLLEQNQGNFSIANLLKMKNNFENVLKQILPEPQASLLSGLLYGQRSGLPSSLVLGFNKTGTAHIMAVSGYNISVLVKMILALLIGFSLPRKKSLIPISLFLIAFVIISGFTSSVIRAAIMGFLVGLVQTLGRLSSPHHALLLAAGLMLAHNPKILRWDLGFQLSFLATFGLLYLSPILEKNWERFKRRVTLNRSDGVDSCFRRNDTRYESGGKNDKKGKLLSVFKQGLTVLNKVLKALKIKENLLTTFSAIIMTLPLILYTWGNISLVAPLANILILSVIPWIMGWGLVAVLAGVFWLGLARVLAWVVWLFLSYITGVVTILANLKYASIYLGSIHWGIILIIYLILIGWIWKENRK